MNPAVHVTRELARIRDLPRRVYEGPELAEQLSRLLRQPHGRQTLRPLQAQALLEIGTLGGLLGPLPVGSGKTLISFLAPVVARARRPMLLIPAKLRQKTERDLYQARRDWRVPASIRVESYERLGRTQHRDALDAYRPDLLILDEAHRAKNPKASITRRIRRYVEAHPECQIVAISGTITSRSIRDFAHLAVWTLGAPSAPVPTNFHELEEWAEALDASPSREPGALVVFADDTEIATHGAREACRRGYRRRLTATPGVVAMTNDHDASCSLQLSQITTTPPKAVQAAFAEVRDEGCRPDGWYLEDPFAVGRCARELALGFYYRWRPDPPREWLDVRKTWAKACRHIIDTNHRKIDTELGVIQAIRHYPEAEESLRAWQEIKPSFEPSTEPVWLADHAVQQALEWMRSHHGIVWVEHQAFGDRLAEISGAPYYASGGLDRRGRRIEDARPRDGSIIASRKSSGEGRNLQAWSRALVVSPPSSGEIWEQLLGRHHRSGQEADEVAFDVFLGCVENAKSILTALERARYTEQITGQPQKILIADKTFDLQVNPSLPSWRGIQEVEL